MLKQSFVFFISMIVFTSVSFFPLLAEDDNRSKHIPSFPSWIKKISFPKGCQLKEGQYAYVALCAELLETTKKKPLPAILPLFMVSWKPIVKNKVAEHSVLHLKRNVARIVCGSEQYQDTMQIEQIRSKKQNRAVRSDVIVVCPADDYGVIGLRRGYYSQIKTQSYQYYIFGRFLASQAKSLNAVAQNFIDRFHLPESDEIH